MSDERGRTISIRRVRIMGLPGAAPPPEAVRAAVVRAIGHEVGGGAGEHRREASAKPGPLDAAATDAARVIRARVT
jgi:hypothetical protein